MERDSMYDSMQVQLHPDGSQVIFFSVISMDHHPQVKMFTFMFTGKYSFSLHTFIIFHVYVDIKRMFKTPSTGLVVGDRPQCTFCFKMQ